MDHLHVALCISINAHKHKLQARRSTIALQALAEQIWLLAITHDRGHVPHSGVFLLQESLLFIVGAELLFQGADTLDVLAAIDLGKGDLPHALKGDGIEVDIATEVEKDEGEAGEAQDDVKNLAAPRRAGWKAGHEVGETSVLVWGKATKVGERVG